MTVEEVEYWRGTVEQRLIDYDQKLECIQQYLQELRQETRLAYQFMQRCLGAIGVLTCIVPVLIVYFRS